MEPVIWGNSVYTLAYKDHPRYENPVYGELGYATNQNLAWYSWGSANQNLYREQLFAQADLYGGAIATIDTQNEYDFLENAFKESVSFSAWILLPGGGLGAANFNKDEFIDYASIPDYQSWSTGDTYSGYAPEYAVVEISLISSATFSATPKEGAGIFTTSIYLSAGTEASGNLAEGATVYWKVTGVDADDLASGQLSGSGTITNGKLDLQHSLKRDSDTGESFEVSVFSDASMTAEYQIGTTATAAIEESIPDPLTGILDLPGKVNLKNKGQTPFTLFGSNEIDVTQIDLQALRFGNDPDDVVNPSIKKNGSIFAALEDVNQDGIMDLTVKVNTSSLASIIPKGTTDIRAFGQYGNGTELVFGLDSGDSVLFF